MLRVIPKHKGTDHLQGDIKRRIKELSEELERPKHEVNRKDRFGKNVFEGGFLSLDNIGVFDRSAPLPTGGYLEQADGTTWMALFTQNMLELAVELATHDPIYKDMVVKFVEHFLYPEVPGILSHAAAARSSRCGARTIRSSYRRAPRRSSATFQVQWSAFSRRAISRWKRMRERSRRRTAFSSHPEICPNRQEE